MNLLTSDAKKVIRAWISLKVLALIYCIIIHSHLISFCNTNFVLFVSVSCQFSWQIRKCVGKVEFSIIIRTSQL